MAKSGKFRLLMEMARKLLISESEAQLMIQNEKAVEVREGENCYEQ